MVTLTDENRSPDAAVLAVSRKPDRANHLCVELREAGLRAVASTDLEAALSDAVPLLVIDPDGWEDSCQSSLGSFDRRRHCPPAVLFVSSSPLVGYSAGPAFASLLEPASRRDLLAASRRALKARERFCSYWPAALSAPSDRDLKRLAGLLEARTGLAVRRDREESFAQAVRTRMVARLVPSAREYAELLARTASGESEVELLAGQFTVGETYFWRYGGQFRALQNVLLPALARRRGGLGRLRLWSAGCATGEEAYSLAMACSSMLDPSCDWQVLATDLHRPSLGRAEIGEYRPRSLRNLPPEVARRFTVATPRGARVVDELRRRVRFEPLNLGSDALEPWVRENGPFDAIFCRNTLIYFSRPATDRVVGVFEAALADGGGLFLGASESLQPGRRGFTVVQGQGSFYYAKEVRRAEAGSSRPAAPRGPDAAEALAAAQYARGLALLGADDAAGAAEVFRVLAALHPDDSRGHTGLALLLANEGREAEARRALERARPWGPELAETHYLMGLLDERAGLEAESLLHYERALAVDPEHFMSRFNRAWILRRFGREESFTAELREVRGILRRSPGVGAWVTGGLGLEAVLDLVARGLGELGSEEES